MESSTGHNRYRIVAIRPWASEGSDRAPESLRTFFDNQEGDIEDIRALVASFGAEFDSAVEGAARYEVAIRWQGHRYDLELQALR